MGLFLSFLYVMKILLVNSHQLSELGKKFFYNSQFWVEIKIFFIRNAEIISLVKLKRYIANVDIFGIIISKFCHKKKLYLIILFKVDKSSKIGFHCGILLFNLIIYLKIEGNW